MATFGEITIQAVPVSGQQLSKTGENSLPIVRTLLDDYDDNVIILAAYRRPGYRKKFKKIVETTTVRKVTTTEEVKPTTEKVIPVTTTKVVQVTTEKVERRDRLSRGGDRSNSAWNIRKRVTRPPKIVQAKKPIVAVNVIDDEEEYSLRRARYLFSQRQGRK